ncbi:hypothetical protein E1A91_D09G153900v1 [Gossypium mustelinum]|uniref:Uncharacterized protein n=4 Tax=Gossypium TaxID=3633 RepID=A0A5J5Q8H0_GOSBA|nr:hypothetical protein ES319_D09G148900v1 [Gossypium barbadense]TYG54133.1 hypothetical protein ES288_D09G164600v1 [Gossypium darwinii]TYH54313.1 hypothetical protein ES332_D09G159300v1 [Gossypium tomentosum]TYI65386.1 hypothetical protein E1A91_D09G153900v1 [Gossypium mustelinum]
MEILKLLQPTTPGKSVNAALKIKPNQTSKKWMILRSLTCLNCKELLTTGIVWIQVKEKGLFRYQLKFKGLFGCNTGIRAYLNKVTKFKGLFSILANNQIDLVLPSKVTDGVRR